MVNHGNGYYRGKPKPQFISLISDSTRDEMRGCGHRCCPVGCTCGGCEADMCGNCWETYKWTMDNLGGKE